MNPTSVQLTDYLAAVRRRWRVVALITAVATAAALTVSLLGAEQYDAESQLLFRPDDQVEGLINPSAPRSDDPERELNTAVELIELDTIAQAVRRRLGLDVTVRDLVERVESEASTRSDLITITARDLEPRRAAAIANAFAEEYVEYRRRSARANLLDAARVARVEYESLPAADRATPEGRELRARGRQLRITAALQTGGVEVVRRATPPTAPSRPRPKLSGALGLVLGLGLGIAVALILEFTDRRLRKEEDVEELLELPILASIPPPRRGADGNVQREAFGLLAANLRFATLDSSSNVVLITSPSPADGKTSVTLGVAQALARLGLRVIAIEADLRRPTFAAKATLPPSAGLAGLLAKPGPVAPELVWLDARGLEPVTPDGLKDGLAFAVLPAGEAPPNPQRLLARPAMGAIVDQARSLAEVVLIDTPPIGTVNDAATLARSVDSAVVVVRLGQTTKEAARRAVRGLRRLDLQLAGAVLTNAVDAEQYGYYGSPSEPATAARGEVAQG